MLTGVKEGGQWESNDVLSYQKQLETGWRELGRKQQLLKTLFGTALKWKERRVSLGKSSFLVSCKAEDRKYGVRLSSN